MAAISLPREGGCRCGQLRFRVTMRPLITMACHCRGCQRMTASAFSLAAALPRQAFTLVHGETEVGGLRGAARHQHCPFCMSWVFTEPAGMDAIVVIRTSQLDDPSGFEPFIETGTLEKLPWAATPAVHSFEKFPPPEAYDGLIAAYAAKDG